MELKNLFQIILCSYILVFPSMLWSNHALVVDTCTANDDCQNAIVITEVISDLSYVCVAGCNMYASPDSLIDACQMGDFPTVWYKVTLDDIATVMNIEVYSTDFESPVISVFRDTAGCDDLEQVYLTNSNLACIIGSDGAAKAIGTPVNANDTYYIAISSLLSIGGHFELCINTLSTGSACVLDRDIEITARSNGGPLEGPFDPNETISFCLNVNSFTAANNGCQWFQGIVPVFGNGWDFSSFDSLGQPGNALLNGMAIGDSLVDNGLYGSAVWDWFDNVGYHHDHPNLNVGDLDGNGRTDMCNSIYEVDCPHKGVKGGCCAPCWDVQGDTLPPGWFAYGINGTCATPGPPIAVDWGDGNTCGGGMGPWSFCFDLTTRDLPDCLGDSTKKDLSLGFFTFADGEVGAWTGTSSVCALDHPTKLSLNAKCGRITIKDTEELPVLCSGDTLLYPIEEPGISHWEWNISPFWAVPYLDNQGVNGFNIAAPLVNNTAYPVDISGTLIGHESGSSDVVLRKFKFKLYDGETCALVSENSPPGSLSQYSGKLSVSPMPVVESAMLEWTFDLRKDATINIYNSQGKWIEKIPVKESDNNQKPINTQSLVPGIYFVSLSNTDFRYVTKLVKL